MPRKKYDDLDEMRKDLDDLGAALGIRPPKQAKPKGKAAARPADAAKRAPAPADEAESADRPGTVLKNRMRKALGLSLAALAAFAQAGHALDARPAPAKDSLRALRIVISSEYRAGDAVLEIRDPRRADSLLRNVPSRGPLLEAIRDTGLSRELRGRAEFERYWDKLEADHGYPALRGNLAAQDVDKTRVPKAYLFDSSVVVFPGWIVVRKRNR